MHLNVVLSRLDRSSGEICDAGQRCTAALTVLVMAMPRFPRGEALERRRAEALRAVDQLQNLIDTPRAPPAGEGPGAVSEPSRRVASAPISGSWGEAEKRTQG